MSTERVTEQPTSSGVKGSSGSMPVRMCTLAATGHRERETISGSQDQATASLTRRPRLPQYMALAVFGFPTSVTAQPSVAE